MASERADSFWKDLRGEIVWMGASSFEERCSASLRDLQRRDVSVRRTLVVDYPSKVVHQKSKGLSLRRQTRAQIEAAAVAVSGVLPRYLPLEPHASLAILQCFDEIESFVGAADYVIVDLTGFTRAHVLGLAATFQLDEYAYIRSRCVFTYASPIDYDPAGTAIRGWLQVDIGPLTLASGMGDVGSAYGIVLLGHEYERLVAAITELEPRFGVAVIAYSPTVATFGNRAEEANRRFIRWWRDDDGGRTVELVSVENLREVKELTLRTVAAASETSSSRAPVFLYPFGPKTLCFAAAETLASVYPERSWYSYPIPRAYSASHVRGIRSVAWFDSNLDHIESRSFT